jgi:hypothetical protein
LRRFLVPLSFRSQLKPLHYGATTSFCQNLECGICIELLLSLLLLLLLLLLCAIFTGLSGSNLMISGIILHILVKRKFQDLKLSPQQLTRGQKLKCPLYLKHLLDNMKAIHEAKSSYIDNLPLYSIPSSLYLWITEIGSVKTVSQLMLQQALGPFSAADLIPEHYVWENSVTSGVGLGL